MPSIANEPVLLRSDEHGIATLTLNRGDKFNALSLELINAVQRELDTIAKDSSVRVVVIAAAGKAFDKLRRPVARSTFLSRRVTLHFVL